MFPRHVHNDSPERAFKLKVALKGHCCKHDSHNTTSTVVKNTKKHYSLLSLTTVNFYFLPPHLIHAGLNGPRLFQEIISSTRKQAHFAKWVLYWDGTHNIDFWNIFGWISVAHMWHRTSCCTVRASLMGVRDLWHIIFHAFLPHLARCWSVVTLAKPKTQLHQ